MTIPAYESIMLPLLRLSADDREHKFRDAVEALATQFALTADERAELLPSGTSATFDNRVGWARTYLKQAGLLSSARRGYFQISEAGKQLLLTAPPKIDVGLLEQYPEFRAFRSRRKEVASDTAPSATPAIGEESHSNETPEDQLASAYRRIRQELELELLEQVRSCSPAFFERLVIDLIISMGYGGSRQDAGRAIGRSGDGGIDGIIKEDKLGLDAIYIQAKRWEGTVGRPEVQKFAGALQGHRANKGVFITTSSYSREASEYAGQITTKIVLIAGEQLASLMVEHNVGVSTTGMYELKKIDSDYFEGE